MFRSGGVFYMNNSKKDDLDTKIALFRYELIVHQENIHFKRYDTGMIHIKKKDLVD